MVRPATTKSSRIYVGFHEMSFPLIYLSSQHARTRYHRQWYTQRHCIIASSGRQSPSRRRRFNRNGIVSPNINEWLMSESYAHKPATQQRITSHKVLLGHHAIMVQYYCISPLIPNQMYRIPENIQVVQAVLSPPATGVINVPRF